MLISIDPRAYLVNSYPQFVESDTFANGTIKNRPKAVFDFTKLDRNLNLELLS